MSYIKNRRNEHEKLFFQRASGLVTLSKQVNTAMWLSGKRAAFAALFMWFRGNASSSPNLIKPYCLTWLWYRNFLFYDQFTPVFTPYSFYNCLRHFTENPMRHWKHYIFCPHFTAFFTPFNIQIPPSAPARRKRLTACDEFFMGCIKNSSCVYPAAPHFQSASAALDFGLALREEIRAGAS